MAKKRKHVFTAQLLKPRSAGDVPLDADLEWFLRCSSSALGERSAMASQIAAIEIGGGTRTPDAEAMVTDRILGLGQTWVGDVERERKCLEAWKRISFDDRSLLLARYCLIVGKLPPGFLGAFGDLAGVVIICAHRRGESEKLLSCVDRSKNTSGTPAKQKVLAPWAKRAQEANAMAHAEWILARAEVEQVA